MCLLVCALKLVDRYPAVVAANRDEALARPGLPPRLVDPEHGIVCPVDPRAGGTWLGVNRHGMLAAVTDRPTPDFDPARRSRGLLCLDALRCGSVADALAAALHSCRRRPYNHFNLLLADASQAVVLHYEGTPRPTPLEPGLHVLAYGDVDDGSIAKARRARELVSDATRDVTETLACLERLCADHEPDRSEREQICVHGSEFATLSSSIVALPDEGPGRAIFLHAAGNPCRSEYTDCSALLRQP